MQQRLGGGSRFWVLPFDRKHDDSLKSTFTAANAAGRHLVLVDDRFNNSTAANDKVMYRVCVPDVNGKELVAKLKGLATEK